MAAIALSALALPVTTAASPQPEDPPDGSRRCDAMTVEGTPSGEVRQIVSFSDATAIAHARRYGSNTALRIWVRGSIGCDELRGDMAAVLLAPDERVALELLGWRVLRVHRFRADGVGLHQVWAAQGGKRISYVRRGSEPRLGRAVYRAGQSLGFPRTLTTCTSAYVLRLPIDGTLLGLTAGHCSAYPFFSASGVFETEIVDRVIGFRKERVTLGPAVSNAYAGGDGPDAMQFALHDAALAAQEVDRSNRTPHRVIGVLPLSRQRKGLAVCFTGIVSGIDRCGRVHGQSTFPNPVPVICARGVRSRDGDSGAPVYTRPNRRGEVRAVGVLARTSVGGLGRDMCYTPIQTILETFGAELPTGSFAIRPPPPPPPGS
jgi:hypothetical protein